MDGRADWLLLSPAPHRLTPVPRASPEPPALPGPSGSEGPALPLEGSRAFVLRAPQIQGGATATEATHQARTSGADCSE